jgi:seryl-tRNA synthetase
MPRTSRNGLTNRDGDEDAEKKGTIAASSTSGAGLSEKLDALAVERDMLRREVAELRQSLEDITSQHEQEVKDLREKLDAANEGREDAEQKHATLLERVNNISATLGERLKSNVVCYRIQIAAAPALTPDRRKYLKRTCR